MPSPPLLIAMLLSASPAGEVESVERIYDRGKTHFEQKEYVEASEAFEEILAMLPESTDNRAVRESIMINVLETRSRAFAVAHDPAHVEHTDALVQAYEADFRAVHGDDEPLAADYVVARDRFAADTTVPEIEAHPCLTMIEPCLEPIIADKQGCGGRGDDPGLMASLLLPLGLRRRQVFDRIADTLPPDVAARLRRKIEDESS